MIIQIVIYFPSTVVNHASEGPALHDHIKLGVSDCEVVMFSLGPYMDILCFQRESVLF